MKQFNVEKKFKRDDTKTHLPFIANLYNKGTEQLTIDDVIFYIESNRDYFEFLLSECLDEDTVIPMYNVVYYFKDYIPTFIKDKYIDYILAKNVYMSDIKYNIFDSINNVKDRHAYEDKIIPKILEKYGENLSKTVVKLIDMLYTFTDFFKRNNTWFNYTATKIYSIGQGDTESINILYHLLEQKDNLDLPVDWELLKELTKDYDREKDPKYIPFDYKDWGEQGFGKQALENWFR